MACFVRFVVHQRIQGDARHVGLFTAAYHLREEGDLTRQDRARLNDLLAWFVAELAVPPRGSIPARALFWYSDVGPFASRMWALARLLNDHGFTCELITTRTLGHVVYHDAHQIAAIPPRRRRRAVRV